MTPDPEAALPLKPADFHIMLVLLRGDLHGYGIMQAVNEESGGRVQLEVGSLYRLIARLRDAGLVHDSARSREPGDNRRYYRITDFGEQVARLETRRLADVLAAAKRQNLLHDVEPS